MTYDEWATPQQALPQLVSERQPWDQVLENFAAQTGRPLWPVKRFKYRGPNENGYNPNPNRPSRANPNRPSQAKPPRRLTIDQTLDQIRAEIRAEMQS